MALGASNLTRGFETVVRVARQEWGEDLSVLAALGHGRSYGLRSRFLLRDLPPILECGLWRALVSDGGPVRALVTDVGNDIAYGAEPAQILGWVEECLDRLQGADTILTGLPMHTLRTLGRVRFNVVRRTLVPSCRLSLAEVQARAEVVEAGLAALALRHGVPFLPMPADWYGLDPIHIRPRLWSRAWSRIVLGEDRPHPRAPDRGWWWLRLYAAAPERQWLAGRERRAPQPSVRWGRTSVSLY